MYICKQGGGSGSRVPAAPLSDGASGTQGALQAAPLHLPRYLVQHQQGVLQHLVLRAAQLRPEVDMAGPAGAQGIVCPLRGMQGWGEGADALPLFQ